MKTKHARKTPPDIKLANTIAITSSTTYAIMRLIEGIHSPEYLHSSYIVLGMTAVLLVILLSLMYLLRGTSALAFIVAPLDLIGFTVGAYLTKDFEYYYLAIACVSGIACFYKNRRALVFYFMINIIVNLALVFFFFPRWEFTNIINMYIELGISSFVIGFMLLLNYNALTKERRADKALIAFESLLSTTPNYTVIADEADIVRYISKPMADLASISERSLAVERPLLDLFGDVNVKMMFGDILDANERFEDTREMTIDGEKRHFKIIASRLEGEWSGVFIDITDVTPTVRAKQNAEKARLEAEAANASKSNFLAKMSHEIRTPMNAVMGMSELLLRKELPQETHEHALMIKNASSNLLSIINDILDFSKIESGMLEIVETEYMFPSLMNDVVNIIRMRLVEKRIQFVTYIDPAIPAYLIGDEVRLRQIVTNLLSNAVKYTNEGYISLSVTGRTEGHSVVLTIEISDSGIGIKEEDIGRLFGDFVQFDAAKNKGVEGTGLGLAITRNLCRLMGGDIAVSSEYGKGSVFTVTLSQRFEKYEPFAVVNDPEEKAVLLYETRAIYRDSVGLTLEKLGVPYQCAQNIPSLFEHIDDYEYIFISSFMYGSIRPALSKSEQPATLVLLADVTEAVAPKDAKVLSLPAHALSVANILNGIRPDSGDGETGATGVTGASFTASEAKVLIVDDVTANLKVAEGLMAPYEMQVTLCSGGADALGRIARDRYDLVFMDHMMPEMDGLEVTRRIRAMEGAYFKSLPIVALTANAVSGVREMFIQNEMNDFLAKPIETVKLDIILDKWIPKEKRKQKHASALPKEQNGFIKLLETIPELSVKRALDVVGGSAEAYENIVRLTARLLPENIESLESLADRDWAKYTIAVHGVKGVLNNMGAYGLGDEAQELEDLSRGGELDACSEKHASFIARLSQFQTSLQRQIEGIERPAKTDGDLSLLQEVFSELEKAVEFYDSAQALGILTGLDAHSFGSEIDETLEAIKLALDHFDFDSAEAFLGKLKERL